MADIIKFLKYESVDSQGRWLGDLWKLDHVAMEKTHDVIQWLFPSDIPSKCQLHSPVLTDEQVNIGWRDAVIRKSLQTSSVMYSKFLADTKPNWIRPKDHNYLRITRVLRCMWIFRMGNEFLLWRENMEALFNKHSEDIGAVTFRYWMNIHDDDFVKGLA